MTCRAKAPGVVRAEYAKPRSQPHALLSACENEYHLRNNEEEKPQIENGNRSTTFRLSICVPLKQERFELICSSIAGGYAEMLCRYRIHGEAIFQLCAEVASNENVVQDRK